MSLNWSIETHDEVLSTQEIIKGMTLMNVAEGQVVQAARQLAGRGRHGRKWESLDGNLFLSLLLTPSCKAQDVGQISLIAGIALADAIAHFLPDYDGLMLKWPNDVLMGGEKCAGILLETELGDNGAVKWVALGLGVNIAEAPKGLGRAINDEANDPVAVNDFRDVFLKKMGWYYTLWLRNGFEDLRELWLSKAHKEGTRLTLKLGPHLESGVFHDIDAFGNLRLRDDEHRIRVITSGEVYLY